MKVEYNVDIKQYTTLHIGGQAENFYTPESPSELLNLIKRLDMSQCYLIGGGSNLLVNDAKTFTYVVNLREFNNEIAIEKGEVTAGASVRLQKFINEINKAGYGGIEYLYSVPGLLGGAIAMNAGRGRKYHSNISDYIKSVNAIDLKTNEMIELSKEQCQFSYRHSIFKDCDKSYIIIGARFVFDKVDESVSNKAKKDRMKYVNKAQDHEGYNAGSVFSVFNKYIMRIMMLPLFGEYGNCHFSRKTSNWIVNNGKGTYAEAMVLLNRASKIHKALRLPIERELKIWD